MEIYSPFILDGATGTELQNRGYNGAGTLVTADQQNQKDENCGEYSEYHRVVLLL